MKLKASKLRSYTRQIPDILPNGRQLPFYVIVPHGGQQDGSLFLEK
jgi:hypothetical protein